LVEEKKRKLLALLSFTNVHIEGDGEKRISG